MIYAHIYIFKKFFMFVGHLLGASGSFLLMMNGQKNMMLRVVVPRDYTIRIALWGFLRIYKISDGLCRKY